MKVLFSTFFFMLVFYNLNGQPIKLPLLESDTLNQVDKNGRKFGYWQHYYFNTEWAKVITSEGYYLKNKQIGTWRNYNYNSAITKIDTMNTLSETILIYNKGQFVTFISFDSSQIIHFRINSLGERNMSDKCTKIQNTYTCQRYSSFGISIQKFTNISFPNAIRKIFD